MANSIPRPEYPRPQMVRPSWQNLNGEWDFEFDFGKTGRDRKMYEGKDYTKKILVPFCPESKLSGIGYKDFMNAVWYHRTFPKPFPTGRTLLHFGASDYKTEVWVNEKSVGTHMGGYVSFTFDITDYLKDGENHIAVCAEDDNRSGRQPRGKQSYGYFSGGCDYTRTTGIWQTVWLENVPEVYLESYKSLPDPKNSKIDFKFQVEGSMHYTVTATAFLDGKEVGSNTVTDFPSMSMTLSEVALWDTQTPTLYDLEITVSYGDSVDFVEGYFGMRSITWDNKVIRLNDKPVFQRLVLDQGFYEDGIYTAPCDEDLKKDIELSLAMGFNGARLHQKIFEERFLYYADKMGYLVWGETGNWGMDVTEVSNLETFLPEWMEAVKRDFNHPALIGWCPFNETWDIGGRRQNDNLIAITYQVTKAMDPTRPVIDTSGFFHTEKTDIYDVHDYDQNPETFAERYESLKEDDPETAWPGGPFVEQKRQQYRGEPYFMSEYGGICWDSKVDNGWGYGNTPKSEEEFISRYKGLTEAMLKNDRICAFCYTQLYDIEQETNGLYYYDRTPKFDPKIFYDINTQKAAIEEE